MKRIITMSSKDLERVEVFLKLKEKALSQSQAADILGISDRQIRRLFKEYKKTGITALLSKRQGRRSNHQLSQGTKELALGLIRSHYLDFGPTLAHEKLVEVHGLAISLSSVRDLMITEQVWIAKKVKVKRIYQLRERRSCLGELVQMDGSPHDWFEGRAPKCSLLHCIDDATGKIMAAFFAPSEDMWGYFELLTLYLIKHGRPVALYSDKHAVFKVNKSDGIRGEGNTQFGRAMQELDIKMIFANSPQAKGRIERSNRTLQDRLTKELRLRGISTLNEANAFLPEFLEDYNRRFAVMPKESHNAHKPLLKEHKLDYIFTIKGFRYLSKSLTFQYKNTLYQILTERASYTLANAKISIREAKDGSLTVYYKEKSLSFVAYNRRQKQGEEADAKCLNEVIDNLIHKQEGKRKYKPSENHPWKRWVPKTGTTG